MIVSRLGLQLVENGIITDQQLATALDYQKERQAGGVSLKLGESLIQLGFCTDHDIAQAMSKKTGYDLMSLNQTPVDMAAANLITPAMAQRYNAIPVGFKDGKLMVAIHDPNNLFVIDDLQIITGHEIRPIVVSDEELRAVIERFSNLSSSVEQEEKEDIGQDLETAFGSKDDTSSADQPAVLLGSQIINSAVRAGASDIHIEPQAKIMRVRFRIDGVLHEIMQQPSSMHASLVTRIKVLASMDIAERRIPLDGRTSVKVDGRLIDIRVASLPSAYGEKMVLRLLNRSGDIMKLPELRLYPEAHERFSATIAMPYGFILVTGPTGSGKSTTLYACLAELNSPGRNIITLEDPVEYRMEGLNQTQINAKAGMTFASGLRSILRCDPDVIMVGEIRDTETAKIAVESALTGHLVLSTLHTNDAASAITRLGEMGVERYLTVSSLAGVIAQRLVRTLCPRCKEQYTIKKEQLIEAAPDFPVREDEDEVTLCKSVGCLSCNNTGYKGRCGVYEFLPVTDEIKKLILTGASDHEIKQMAVAEGMETLLQDGYRRVREGITTMEELFRVVV